MAQELTQEVRMSEDEKLVNDTWEGVSYENGRVYSLHYFSNGRWILSGKDAWDTEEKAWWSAATFTRALLKEIEEIEEEIALIADRAIIPPQMTDLYKRTGLEFSPEFLQAKDVFVRILTRLATALEAKRMGLKGEK